MTVREPEWDDEAQGEVLALLAEERETCPGCGQPIAECRDKATAGHWQVFRDICQATRVLEAVQESDAKDGGARGVFYGVRRT